MENLAEIAANRNRGTRLFNWERGLSSSLIGQINWLVKNGDVSDEANRTKTGSSVSNFGDRHSSSRVLGVLNHGF
jgi:hypothetical protein